MAGLPQHHSHWETLFDLAVSIMDQMSMRVGIKPRWTLGGGTALMLHIDHRVSHDIDLFLADPQMLPFLNPETQEYTLNHYPDDYDTDGTRALKLSFEALGEIDFICCGWLQNDHASETMVRAQSILLERPQEIIAKKIFYRGSRMQPRDMFDIAACLRSLPRAPFVEALRGFPEECRSALERAKGMDPRFVEGIMKQLLIRTGFESVPGSAQQMTVDLLEEVLGSVPDGQR